MNIIWEKKVSLKFSFITVESNTLPPTTPLSPFHLLSLLPPNLPLFSTLSSRTPYTTNSETGKIMRNR